MRKIENWSHFALAGNSCMVLCALNVMEEGMVVAMSEISEIDVNFAVKTKLDKDDLHYYNVLEKPFSIYGIFMENDRFTRLPKNVAESVSDGVLYLSTNTAGGRVRFKTNSQYVAIYAEIDKPGKMPHFPYTGSIGFDLYEYSAENEIYKGTIVPPVDVENEFEGIVEFQNMKMRDITVNFPLYSDVKKLYIGLSKEATVKAPRKYKIMKPIVYYGSSITQGGCASRPGNSYQAIISRKFDCDFINLGFSGNAKGEKEISEYIKRLDMSIFVYDYDHNAPTVEHLSDTHERMFNEIRVANPGVPIIIMSRPKYYLSDEEKERLQIIKNTYINACNSGDNNVFFIEGPKLMELAKGEGTVDDCHPNDLGFWSIAECLSNIIEKVI